MWEVSPNEHTYVPAWGKTYNACGRKNHFALMCSVKPRERPESLKCMYVFNFFRDAILISYTAGFHEGRLFSYLQVYKIEEKTN